VEPAFLKGSLITYWRLLNSNGYILNWNGDVSRKLVDTVRSGCCPITYSLMGIDLTRSDACSSAVCRYPR